MELDEILAKRRSLRALEPEPISRELMEKMVRAAALAPSCFNNQPWRFVFIRDRMQLDRIKEALSVGNEWARRASLIVAVCSSRDDDCVVKKREYHQFDTGMATAFLMLKATELGLVAHAIAGFRAEAVRENLGIPDSSTLITLIICGVAAENPEGILPASQIEAERERPPRLPLEKIMRMDGYSRNGNGQ